MIDFGIILIIAVAALMAVQAIDVECVNPPRRFKPRPARSSGYVPGNTVTN